MKGSYKQKDQVVSSRLELSPKRKPLAKAHALFHKGLKEVEGDEPIIFVVYCKIQMSFFVESAKGSKCTPAGEGWAIKPDDISGICTEFSEALFEAVVNSS